MASAMAAWQTHKEGAGQGLEGDWDEGPSMAALVPPTNNLASSRDATLDTASGRQRRIFNLSVAVLCDRRLTAVGSRGKGGRNVSVSPEPVSLARLKKHLGSSLPVRELIGWIASLSA